MLTNDDGWNSVGLLASWHSVRDLAPVTVVAPGSHMSGVGKATTILRPISLRRFILEEMEGYRIDGTPADCVNIGVHKLLPAPPALLVSGINLGPNLGLDDLTSSGTMGACLQAAMYGVPSVCISYCLQDYSREITLEELSMGGAVLSSIAGWILRNGMPRGVDVVVASVPECRGIPPEVRETRLAISPLPDIYEEKPGGTYGFLPRTLDFYDGEGEDTDVTAIKEGCISIASFSLNSLIERKHYLEEMAIFIGNGLEATPRSGASRTPHQPGP